MVYLITGKRNAGKSTYAFHLVNEFKKDGCEVDWFDGDAWRSINQNEDFSDDGRLKNLMSAAKAAQAAEMQGHVAILSFIAPRKEWRQKMRALWQQSILVYIPGGSLWENTIYERPDLEELKFQFHGEVA